MVALFVLFQALRLWQKKCSQRFAEKAIVNTFSAAVYPEGNQLSGVYGSNSFNIIRNNVHMRLFYRLIKKIQEKFKSTRKSFKNWLKQCWSVGFCI